MNTLEKIKEIVADKLNLDKNLFSYPPESSLGDLSFPCFLLAKIKKITPIDLAKNLTELSLKDETLKEIFEKVEAVGPYVNFFIKPEYLASQVISEIKKAKNKYGFNEEDNSSRIMIEYSNGNTHKEYHVGHLRNISYGEAVKNLLITQGHEVIPVSFINDFGIHTAKTIWNWRLNPVYSERPERKGFLLGKCYAEAAKKLTDNEELKEEVAEVMKNIESRQGLDYETWQETRKWSIDYFNSIYQELNIKFIHIFYESELIDRGLKMVTDLLAKGILKKSEGAVIADLNEYNLGVLPVIRSNGTALYPVADLALASEKFDKYNISTSIYITDIRQSLHFKQLFKVLELAGYKEKMFHLVYDFVTLPGAMMSSRTGNVVTYEDLKNKVFTRLLQETKRRHDNWTETRLEKVAKSLTISTIKFEMLKVGAEKIITFNIDEAARSDGFTACYILYGYARIKSVIRKAGFNLSFLKTDLSILKETKEKELLLKMAKYSEVLVVATDKKNPAELIKYLFELVQIFNDYYHNYNILKSNRKIKLARLELLKSLAVILAGGFNIIGLEALEEM